MPQLPTHRDCEILTGLTLERLPANAPAGRRRRYAKGAHIWHSSDPASSIYFLRSGQVILLSSDDDGREMILRVVDAGQPFGELCLCAERDGIRGTTARAAVESDATEISFDGFLKCLREDQQALLSLVYTFCIRLRESEQRAEVLAKRSAEARIGSLLLQLASSHRKPHPARSDDVSIRASHEQIAQLAAMSRAHVTVTLGKLRRRRLLQYRRGGPIVVNVPALSEYLAAPDEQNEAAAARPKR